MSRKKMHMDEWRQSPLYTLMLERLPKKYTDAGIVDVPGISTASGYSYEAIYTWWRSGKLSVKSAQKIANLCRGKLPIQELYPFVFAN